MRILAHRLIAAEHRSGDSEDTQGRAAFRVCNKLREPISTLAGALGFRTLFARALTLAKAEVAWLGKLEVGANGALAFPPELEQELSTREAGKGGVALVVHLLELLETLIGEALTLRLAQQVWPKAAPGDPKSVAKT